MSKSKVLLWGGAAACCLVGASGSFSACGSAALSEDSTNTAGVSTGASSQGRMSPDVPGTKARSAAQARHGEGEKPEARSTSAPPVRALQPSDCIIPTGAKLVGLDVLFRIDPRLTRGMSMGDRWVAAPRYSAVQNGSSVMVAARAQGRDSAGQGITLGAIWTSMDPSVASVVAAPASDVVITAARPGETRVRVACGSVSADLDIQVRSVDGVLRAEISRQGR